MPFIHFKPPYPSLYPGEPSWDPNEEEKGKDHNLKEFPHPVMLISFLFWGKTVNCPKTST